MDYDIFFAKHVIAICRLCMVIKHVVFCDPLQVSLLDFPWVLDYILATRFNCSLRQIRHAVCSIAEVPGDFWGPRGPTVGPSGPGLTSKYGPLNGEHI